MDTAYCGCAKGVVYAARSVGFTENETCIVQVDPADIGSNPVVGNEQTVLVSISVLCVLVCGHRGLLGGICYMVGCRFQHIGVDRAGIGKRHIMQGAVRQIAVYRAGNIHRRKVKIVSAAGGEGELLVDLVRQLHFPKCAGIVGLMIAVKLLVEHAERLAGHVYAGQVNRCPAACTVCRAVQLHNACIAGNAPVRILNNGRYIFIIAHFCVLVFDLQHTTVDQHRLCRKIVAVAVMQGQLPFISGVFGDRGR